MKKIIIHILDSKIIYQINNKSKPIEIELCSGKINQEENFIKILKKLNKENFVNQSITGDEAIIIVNDLYTMQDIKYLHQLFIELQFNKITIFKESELLNSNMAPIVILDTDFTRFFIPNQNPIFISSLVFNKKILNIIKKMFSIKDKTIVINLNNSNFLGIEDKSLFLLTFPTNYLIDKIMPSTNPRSME